MWHWIRCVVAADTIRTNRVWYFFFLSLLMLSLSRSFFHCLLPFFSLCECCVRVVDILLYVVTHDIVYKWQMLTNESLLSMYCVMSLNIVRTYACVCVWMRLNHLLFVCMHSCVCVGLRAIIAFLTTLTEQQIVEIIARVPVRSNKRRQSDGNNTFSAALTELSIQHNSIHSHAHDHTNLRLRWWCGD